MRILIVEDERRIAKTIKKGLEQERFAVDVVFDGQEGYDMASAENYDIMILDRMMPGIDGMELCRKLRAEHIHTPILMLTAKSQIQDKVDGLECGADDYLTKPFSFAELVARVRAIARRPKHTKHPVLVVSDVSLDPKTFRVTRGLHEINLSSKEFALLEYLMSNAQTVLSKDQIIAHVW
ncbi:response regulator transcription factor, partial [Candidatus Woesebacteria bacterium]|nr:response regulator transcription factor [Candidatus Woesebacteria bacterium]